MEFMSTLTARPATVQRLAGSSQDVVDAASRILGRQPAAIGQVARALAVSPRTLQRRLESRGTTFGELRDATRRQQAIQYLRDPGIAIKEIAGLLGFSEPSTFYRAFRRWTGATPAHFRRSIQD
jgi:AraC-like DNA-binding protein